MRYFRLFFFFFFQAEDGIRDLTVTGVQTCALPILSAGLIRNVDQFKVSGMEFQSSYDSGKVFADLSAHYYFKAKTCAPDIAAERRAYGVQRRNAELAGTPDCVDGDRKSVV